MAIDTSAIQTFTEAELLAAYRECLMKQAFGQTVSISGQSLTFPGPAECRAMIDWLEQRVNAAAGDGFTAQIVFQEK